MANLQDEQERINQPRTTDLPRGPHLLPPMNEAAKAEGGSLPQAREPREANMAAKAHHTGKEEAMAAWQDPSNAPWSAKTCGRHLQEKEAGSAVQDGLTVPSVDLVVETPFTTSTVTGQRCTAHHARDM